MIVGFEPAGPDIVKAMAAAADSKLPRILLWREIMVTPSCSRHHLASRLGQPRSRHALTLVIGLIAPAERGRRATLRSETGEEPVQKRLANGPPTQGGAL